MAGELLTREQGEYLVKFARKTLQEHLQSGKRPIPEQTEGIFAEQRGVFVTLETYPEGELRGCIGYPTPVKPLIEAVADNAVNAATGDPRFPEVTSDELGKITFEVSVLTVPEEMQVENPEEYTKKIKIGKDGLIIKYGFRSGLLLPQVPVELNWEPREFLEHLCLKAGLPKDMWLSANISISTFQAQIFSEETPEGKVEMKKLFK